MFLSAHPLAQRVLRSSCSNVSTRFAVAPSSTRMLDVLLGVTHTDNSWKPRARSSWLLHLLPWQDQDAASGASPGSPQTDPQAKNVPAPAGWMGDSKPQRGQLNAEPHWRHAAISSGDTVTPVPPHRLLSGSGDFSCPLFQQDKRSVPSLCSHSLHHSH